MGTIDISAIEWLANGIELFGVVTILAGAVVARGGGSVEDLLPFSDEALLRAVHRARTPVVSAIGHEPDTPLLDLVADVRASTPTDAAKMVVPDVAEEVDRITRLRDRARQVMSAWLAQQPKHLVQGLG